MVVRERLVIDNDCIAHSIHVYYSAIHDYCFDQSYCNYAITGKECTNSKAGRYDPKYRYFDIELTIFRIDSNF